MNLSRWLPTGFLMALAVALGACQSPKKDGGPPGKEPPKPPKNYQPASAEMISLPGENCCGRYFPEGHSILYLSRNRPRHEGAQVYAYDLTTRKESRLTHHRGETQGPLLTPEKTLLYASTTDEDKESPNLLRQTQKAVLDELHLDVEIGPRPFWSNQTFEIYSSKMTGQNIRRLTHSPGFDAEASLHPNGKWLAFTSTRSRSPRIYLLELEKIEVRELIKSPQALGEPAWSPDGKWLAYQKLDEDKTSSQIWIATSSGKKAKAITQGPGLKLSPSWADHQHLLYSSNESDPENFELYIISTEGNCQGRLTYNLAEDSQPQASPDGRQILFTSDRGGSRQLYQMALKPPTCSPLPEP